MCSKLKSAMNDFVEKNKDKISSKIFKQKLIELYSLKTIEVDLIYRRFIDAQHWQEIAYDYKLSYNHVINYWKKKILKKLNAENETEAGIKLWELLNG